MQVSFKPSEEQLKQPRTIIVMGAPRGGTSVVSGLLYWSGIHMGDNLGFQYEDPDFHPKRYGGSSSDKEEFYEHIIETAKNRNENHDVWGWKLPNSIYYLDKLMPHLRNPFIVMIYRNPLDISLSSAKHDKSEWSLKRLLSAVGHTQKMTNILEKYPDIPCLLLGLETLKKEPELFAKGLSDFLGISIESETTSKFFNESYTSPQKMRKILNVK